MALALDDHERAMLAGEHGEGAALAARLVIRAAEVLGAERLIPITRAHVDSCLYHGEATIDFVQRLVDGQARVAVPTTLNVGTLDLLHPELWRGSRAVAERGRLLMEAYRSLGCRPTFTCAPYQLADARPRFGEQVAWAESNAIAFCNAVIGARTERYGDFTDIACAVMGRVPDAGLHRDEARRATLVLRLGSDVPDRLLGSDALFPPLGVVLGRRAGSRVAAIAGLPPDQSEDRLKAVAAAAASSGSVAMFHVVGSTPEAPTLGGRARAQRAGGAQLIGLRELREARDTLTSAEAAQPGTPIGAVSLGTPHASRAELREIAILLEGAQVAPAWSSWSRPPAMSWPRRRPTGPRNASGLRAELLGGYLQLPGTDLRPSPLPTMTDSAKWAWYAPANIGAQVVFASREECVRSAIDGRVWRDPAVWGDA